MGRAALLGAVVMAAAIAGCGEDEQDGQQRPQLPSELAAALAAESEAVAQSLDAGQGCAALRQAQALQARIGEAVSGGEVDPQLGAEMSEATQTLADGIECAPAPEPSDTTTTPTSCEAIEAQIDRLKAEAEQSKEEGGGPGSEEPKKRLKEQAKALEDQFKEECQEGERGEDGGEGDGGDGGPGNGEGGGGPRPGHGNGGGGDD